MGGKMLLSRLPLAYAAWRKIGLFRHGAMLNSPYAAGVFRRHSAAAGPMRDGFTVLELGPGDSVLTGVLARLAGASQTWLVDAGDFAGRDLTVYRHAAQHLIDAGGAKATITPDAWSSFDEMLEDCRISYLTGGLESLRQIPESAVDHSFSHAVLEHVRYHEFGETMGQLRRVAAAGGLSTHQVDLRDHLGGSLNNLRFSNRLWESNFFVSSGFYTNRLRYVEMLELARSAGWNVRGTETQTWPAVPTRRDRLHPSFRRWPDDELRVMGFFVELEAPQLASSSR